MLVVFTDSNSQLPNHLFEELAMDVYDEIDRREIEASKWTRKCIEALIKIISAFFCFYHLG